MAQKTWHGAKWPKGVPFEIADFDRPLFSLLDISAREYPNLTYTIFNGASRTFAQVKDAADRVANFLAARGIKPKDRVALFLPNLPHYPEIFFGALKAGTVCVTCNPLYLASELNFQLRDSGAKALFVMDHPQFYPTAVEAAKGTDVRTVVVCNIKSYLPKTKAILGSLLGKLPKAESIQPGHIQYDDALGSAKPEPPDITVDPLEDLALILYTGGTTGVPKGACLTHGNLLSNVMGWEQWVRIPKKGETEANRIEHGGAHTFLGVLPWYHSFGLTAVMLASLPYRIAAGLHPRSARRKAPFHGRAQGHTAIQGDHLYGGPHHLQRLHQSSPDG